MVEMFHVKHFREVFAGKSFIVDSAPAWIIRAAISARELLA